MARPKKATVDYFPHRCTHGKTMYILEAKYGNDGYAFWFKLLEMLGQAESHTLTLKSAEDWEFLQAKTRLSDVACREILDMLCRLQAIDPALWQEGVVWCENFVKGIASVYTNRRTDCPQKPVSTANNPVSTANNPVSTCREIPLSPRTPLSPESRVDESRVEETRAGGAETPPTPPPASRDCLSILRSVPDYPFDESKDVPMLTEFEEDFPTLNVLNELRAWRNYKRDVPLVPKKSNPRGQLRTWMTKAVQYQQERSGSDNGKNSRTPRRIVSNEDYNYAAAHGHYPDEHPENCEECERIRSRT